MTILDITSIGHNLLPHSRKLGQSNKILGIKTAKASHWMTVEKSTSYQIIR